MNKPRVLIVEDEAIIAMDLGARLTRMGYAVIATTASGAEAIRCAIEHKPDLVLMDVVLAGDMDGVHVAEQMIPLGIPVIYITAYSDDVTLQRARATGPYGYILKPFQERELRSTIEITLHRHRVEHALQENQRWLAAILESIGDVVIATDATGRVTFTNAVAEALTGYTQEMVAGQSVAGMLTILDAATRTPVSNPVMAALDQGTVVSLNDHFILLHNGAETPIECTASPIRDERDGVMGIVLVIKDVTERKQSEKALQQSVQDLDTLNRVSRLLISTLDLEQVAERLMQAVTGVLGVAGSSLWLWSKSAPDELECRAAFHPGLACPLVGVRVRAGQGVAGAVAQSGESAIVNSAARDPRFYSGIDQQTGFHTDSLLVVPLRARDRVLGVLEAVNKPVGEFDAHDLTLAETLASSAAIAIENAQLYLQAQQEIAERKRAEAALEQERASLAQRVEERTTELRLANLELARSSQMKDEFMAAMSHELRTPLNAILGLSEALQELVYGPLTEKQIKSLNTIEQSGRQLLTMINGILDLTKIGAGKLDVQIEAVPVGRVCESSLRFVEQAADRKRLHVVKKFDSRVTMVQADERRLKQVLINLLDNAVKFTPEDGSIGLEVNGDVAQGLAHLTVWDTGIGVEPKDMARLFEPFVQLDARLSRHYSGTGLGLALVKRLAEVQGGSVSVESQIGRGSRFTISLPWQPE